MSLLQAGKRNALANYLNFAVITAVTIVVSPLLVAYLGSAQFGIWKALQKFMDFGTVADGRATQALKWFIARGDKTDSDQEKRQAVGSAVVVWALFFPLTLVFGIGIVVAVPSLIAGINPDQFAYVQLVAGLLALNLVLVPLLGVSDSVLVGINQGYASMVVKTVVLTISNFGMVLMVWYGYGLMSMAFLVLGASLITAAITYRQARKRAQWFGLARPTRAQVQRFLGFSGWVLVWSLVAKALLAADLILLGYFVGPTTVTDYVFTSYAAQFAVMACFMTTSALMPGLGSLFNDADQDKLSQAIAGVRELTVFLGVVLCSGVILFNHSFVKLWAGEIHYMGQLIDLLIVVEALQLIRIRNEAQIQDLTLRIGMKVTIGICSTLCSFFVAWLLFRLTGQIWSIFVGIIIGRFVMSFIFPKLVDRIVPGDGGRSRRSVFTGYWVFAVCAAVSWQIDANLDWTLTLPAVMLVFACVVWLSWRVLLGPEARGRLLAAVSTGRLSRGGE